MTALPDLGLVANIVSAYVSKNPVPQTELASVINTVRTALQNLGNAPEAVREELKPAVLIRKSVTPDYIVCLEDGKKLKMLKRYLRTAYNLSPDEYRARWGLPKDYPMTAPAYAASRSELAKNLGLGRKRVVEPVQEVVESVESAPKRRGRPRKTA